MQWNELSVSNKAALMRIYIENGITDLDVMQAHYNQQGGKVGRNSNSANSYSSLPNNSRTYERWADAIARHKGINIANDKTYDYRRYYNENTEAAWRMLQANAEEHFPVNSYQRGGKINTDKNRYAFLRIEPEVSVSDNTRVVLPPSLIEIAKARAAYEAEQREKAILEASRRQPQLKADTRTQADRDRAAKQRQQAEYNRRANEAVGNTMSIGRPNTESTQAAVMAAPYVAKAAKNYVQNFDPTAEIRNAMYFVPGVNNVIMAQDARVAFDNNQAGAGVVNAAFALAPMLGVTPNFNSPLRHTRPANKVGDWTILDYGHNTAATTVQESSTASMLNMPSSLRLGSVERPSLSARPTQGSIGTTNRLQLPEMTESFRALENEAFGVDYLRNLYLNDGRISHQNPKTPKTQIQLSEYIKPQIRPLIRGAELKKKLREAYDEKHIEYLPEHEAILKKYDAFPKQFQKLFGKKAEVRAVTDSKGNTWYEVDVPESYKNGTGQIIFSLGGLLGLGAGVSNH